MDSQEWTARLAKVAEVYAGASDSGGGGTLAVQQHFSVSRSTAGAWVGRARAAGLLAGVPPQGVNQRAKAVAAALGVSYEALIAAVLVHAGGDLRVSR